MTTADTAMLPAHISAMLHPDAYPLRIDLIQTHISWVFLAGNFAYKVMKPVDCGFLNFTSLARRRYYC